MRRERKEHHRSTDVGTVVCGRQDVKECETFDPQEYVH